MAIYLSPSQAARWMACPASVYIAERLPRLETTTAASEGTLAHEFAAWALYSTLRIVYPDAENFGATVPMPEYALATDDMISAAGEYAGAVVAKLGELGGVRSYAIESPVAGFAEGDDEPTRVRGRADFYAITDHAILVADFKFGEHPVEARKNPQLLVYAAAVRQMLRAMVGAQDIVVGIIQPRTDAAELLEGGASWYTVPRADVANAEMAIALKVDAAMAADENTPRVPGDHCIFCPARSTCLASVAERLLLAATAAGEYEAHKDATDEQIGRWLSATRAIDKVSEDLARIAKARIANGGKIPGFTVQTRRLQFWPAETTKGTPEEQAEKIASLLGCEPGELLKSSVRSPSEMRKTLGADAVAAVATTVASSAIVEIRK